ncbi:DNA glycosylase [Trametes gibbosa]|nr:DNA glycosylase [Trametes gibbosa]
MRSALVPIRLASQRPTRSHLTPPTICSMVSTRSSSRSTSTGVVDTKHAGLPLNSRKRKVTEDTTEPAPKKARATKPKADTKAAMKGAIASGSARPPAVLPSTNVPTAITSSEGEELVPAVLTFSFEDAKRHLITVDPRFDDVFQRVKCKPFEHLERVDPFRTLAHSILGQQISWKAAASITHKFVRLFDPSIPESLAESDSTFFPSAHQVITKDITTLRSAGLSGRKAEYVLDLAMRFADGRLSTRKLLEADDEELHNILIQVRGIGRWTVDMFAMFSLRRPDILPVGDLGVQRGLLRWFISLHAPSHPVSLRQDKLTDQAAVAAQLNSTAEGTPARATTPDASSVPQAPERPLLPPAAEKGKEKQRAGNTVETEVSSAMPLPAMFTPSINKTLNMVPTSTEDGGEYTPPSLPESLTVAQMKSRLSGKKVKGALLTPKEMEDLTECWRPYRTLGVYHMWALAEEPKSK